MKPKVNGREIVSDISRDILKLFVVERHTASGKIGQGLVNGFGIKRGAVATSIAHDSHNIIVVGVDDNDIPFLQFVGRHLNLDAILAEPCISWLFPEGD